MSAAESSQGAASLDAGRFRPGDRIGDRYELLDCIGTGAMGAVHRVHDRLLDAELALKLIRVDPQHADRERATRRLLVEARAIARISHPGIVRVFDFGCTDVVPFIVMELLEGESLAALLAREGPMSAELAVSRTLAIADAIAVAHRRGVVHRDIKPDNVFLARDEFGRVYPKLVDFGVARLRERATGLTRPGVLMGTPDYMAPEQARAEPDVDERADVWSFAVVLYELMTGRRPFSQGRASYLAILKAIVSEAPEPITSFGVGDAALWAVLERALAKRRSERYASIRDMGQALAIWLVARGVSEDAYGRSLRSSWLTAAPGPTVAEIPARSGPPTLRTGSKRGRSWTPLFPAAMLSPGVSAVIAAESSTRRGRSRAPVAENLVPTLESARVQRFGRLRVGSVSIVATALIMAVLSWFLIRH